MKFWDSSALVPLLVQQPASAAVRVLVDADPAVLVWWAASLECESAIARLTRMGALDKPGAHGARSRLQALEETWAEVEPVSMVRQVARRMIRVHPLRAADALQLAAAVAASGDSPSSLDFVTLDERLADAARLEGFPVVTPRS